MTSSVGHPADTSNGPIMMDIPNVDSDEQTKQKSPNLPVGGVIGGVEVTTVVASHVNAPTYA